MQRAILGISLMSTIKFKKTLPAAAENLYPAYISPTMTLKISCPIATSQGPHLKPSRLLQEEIDRSEPPDAFVVIYSVVDKASLQKAEQELARLVDADMLRARPALLVANKIDLARSRAVSTQGEHKCL